MSREPRARRQDTGDGPQQRRPSAARRAGEGRDPAGAEFEAAVLQEQA
ncbi:hypothetical protein [Streptomyces sp. CC208A]|nr:hypothetical protein [Streptomyces sp. CC208A]